MPILREIIPSKNQRIKFYFFYGFCNILTILLFSKVSLHYFPYLYFYIPVSVVIMLIGSFIYMRMFVPTLMLFKKAGAQEIPLLLYFVMLFGVGLTGLLAGLFMYVRHTTVFTFLIMPLLFFFGAVNFQIVFSQMDQDTRQEEGIRKDLFMLKVKRTVEKEKRK